VIIFNQGNTPDREGLIVADATSVDPPIPGAPGPVSHNIPVVGASFADGVALSQPGSTAFVEVLPAETRTDYNVIAEMEGENDDNVVMAAPISTASSSGLGSRTTAPVRRRCWRRRS
jgi:hypothetical protein